MKYHLPQISIVIILSISLGTSAPALAQVYRVGAGLCFASGYEFNTIEMGNPGFKVKTWIALDRKSTIHIVPTFIVFNKNTADAGYFSISNYSFHGDLDGQYMVFMEKTVKVVVFGGINFSHLTSKVSETDPKYPLEIYAPNAPDNETDIGIGGNLGAGLELRMGSHWDMNVSAKYIVSKYSQFIISVEGVYYFKSRRKAYRR